MSRISERQRKSLSYPVPVAVEQCKGCGRRFDFVAVVRHVQQPGGAPGRCSHCGQINRHDVRLDQQATDDCGQGASL